jgi:hypothetical protein
LKSRVYTHERLEAIGLIQQYADEFEWPEEGIDAATRIVHATDEALCHRHDVVDWLKQMSIWEVTQMGLDYKRER